MREFYEALSLVLSKYNLHNGCVSPGNVSLLGTDAFSHSHGNAKCDSSQSHRGLWNYQELNNTAIKLIYRTAFWEIIFMNSRAKIQVCKLRCGYRGVTVGSSLRRPDFLKENMNPQAVILSDGHAIELSCQGCKE